MSSPLQGKPKYLLEYPLIQALLGKRSRRFFLGAELPDGVFAYKSKHAPVPLSETEKMLLVAACGGNTSWHHMIYRGETYVPHLSTTRVPPGGGCSRPPPASTPPRPSSPTTTASTCST